MLYNVIINFIYRPCLELSQHILASAHSNGTTVVWDLKRQQPVINFRDTSGAPRRCSVLQWNPEVATQLAVASDDDRAPTIQMWDLRNYVSPLKEFVGHSKVRGAERALTLFHAV